MSQYRDTEVRAAVRMPKVHVVLPENAGKVLKKHALTTDDISLQYSEGPTPFLETQYAGVFKSSFADALIPTFVYRLNKTSEKLGASSRTCHVLDISPMQINNDTGSQLRSYAFQLPSACVSNCISVSESEVDNALIVDVITEMNVLVSLRLNIDSFFQQSSSSLLTIGNFYSWCRYSMPYSFDQRAPLIFKALDASTTIISTCDGGLLTMNRSSFESDVSITAFTSTSYISNIKSKIFGFKANTNATDTILNFSGKEISSASAIDAISITADVFCTISSNKTLAFWSLSAQKIINEYHLKEYLPDTLSNAYLAPFFPNGLLKITSNGFLSILLSLGETYIFVFSLDFNEFNLNLVSNLTPPNINTSWSPVGYDSYFNETEGTCKFSVSWMFSDSCYNKSCTILLDDNSGDDGDNSVIWEDTIEFTKFNTLCDNEFLATVDMLHTIEGLSDYVLKFIQSKIPPEFILSTLKIFDSSNSKEFSVSNLENDILDAVNSNSANTLVSKKNGWVKFASVCHDLFHRSAIKTFAIAYDNSNIHTESPFLISVKNNDSYSFIKQASAFESLFFNRRDRREIELTPFTYSTEVNHSELSKLIDLILDYSKGYNDNIQTQILDEIVTSKLETSKLMNEIFDKYIFNTANEQVVSNLLETLSNIKDASTLIQYLTILISTNFEDYRINTSSPFTEVNASIIVQSILSNNASAKKLIMGLTLIILTLDYSKPLESLFKKNLISLKYIHLIDLVTMISKSTDDSKNLLSKYISRVYPGIYVKNNTLNYIISALTENIFSDQFVYFVMAELLGSESYQDASAIINYLPNTALSLVLQALYYMKIDQPKEAKDLFMNNCEQIIQFDINGLSRVLSSVEESINLAFVTNKAQYLFNVSILFEEKKFYLEALEFAISASKQLINSNNGESDEFLDAEIFYKIFDVALRLNQFEMSFSAIKQMKHLNRRTPLKKFIYKLFQENRLNEVVQFDYAADFDFVDGLILSLGEESFLNSYASDLKLSLKYYRVCYALRLKEGDFRGAVEVLYRFNRNVLDAGKAIDEVRYEILKNNYLVMLNLMKSLEKDDQWVIRSGKNGKKDVVVSGAELEQEYITFARAEERGEVLEKRPLYLV